MKKDELKKVLKPLIKECIKEVLLEEKGTLSHIISEVTSGLSPTTKEVVKENKQFNKFNNLVVYPRRNENIERVIKRFNKKVKKLGIISEYREKQRFEKPSDKKRRAKKRSDRRRAKELAKANKWLFIKRLEKINNVIKF